MSSLEHLAVLEVADSKFLGFVSNIDSESDAKALQSRLKQKYPDAAHVPIDWISPDGQKRGFDEDGEPEGSTGPYMAAILDDFLLDALCSNDDGGNSKGGVAVAVVRYFGTKLLGVTCGRLSQCYASITKLALQRYLYPGEALVEEIEVAADKNIYGLAAGDTEVILGVVSDPKQAMLDQIVSEVEFDGFRGHENEELPRKQNLQADGAAENIIPVYRYPGNYRGDEWETFGWSPTTLTVKKAVEAALLPLVEQKMNHCVANLYRKGPNDFIDHHSDKDLDLDRTGVIVSVSLGEERTLELRRRAEPRDTTRIRLPHGSMLVLGPKTNSTFTHSILRKEDSTNPRLSLTLRNVKTYLDAKTGRLYGQGVTAKSLEEVRRAEQLETAALCVGTSVLAAFAASSKAISTTSRRQAKQSIVVCGAIAATAYSLRLLRRYMVKRGEEKEARSFFSKQSVSGTKY